MSRLGVLAMIVFPGCAFVSMRSPANNEPSGVYPVCSDRVGPWVLDSIAGAAAATVTTSAISAREPGIAAAAGAAAGLLIGSAVYGIVTNARCRATRGEYLAPAPPYHLDAPEIPLHGPPPAPFSSPVPAPAPVPAPIVPYSPPGQ